MDPVAGHRALAVDAGDDGGIAELDAGSALVEVGDHGAEAVAFAPFQHHRFGKVEHRPVDLRRAFVGLGHDGGKALEGVGERGITA